ncbi:MAG: DUF6442 family protein [Bacillota bacterium]|nr:DUF6442 family protein [Bacillota bacterium]
MDRDEILNRNKAGKPKDEGKEFIENKSSKSGAWGLSIFFVLLVLYNFFKGLQIYDLLAIFWGYLGVNYISQYRILKTKSALLTAVCGMIAAVGFLLVYIFQTW